MKKYTLSEIISKSNVSRVIAIMMAIALLAFSFAGCKTEDESSSKEGSPSESSPVSSEVTPSGDGATSEDATSSDEVTSSEDATSSEGTTSNNQSTGSTKVDPLDGEITVDYEYIGNGERADAKEITPAVDPASFQYGYKGYADKERDKRVKEILNTPNTAELYDLKGKIYYVSPGGNDSNDGLSPETPIRTLTAMSGLLLEEGDAVLFERGAVFRMLERFNAVEGVTYGSYGEGRKPMIYGSPKNFAQESWKPSKKKNVWQINYMYAYPCGAYFDESKEVGFQKLTMRELEKNTDYFLDEEMATLYVYCDRGNPSKVWKSIEFSQKDIDIHLSTGVDDCVFDNISLRYTGSGGIGSLYNNNGWTVTNCEIAFTGGVWMGSVRGGNGIGTWCGGENLKWDHNWVYQTFDSGMSPQGNIGKNAFDYHDISMCDNVFEYNNCDIETWESGKADKGGPSDYYNYYMDNNICRFTSLGWGTRANDGGIRGIDGVHYGHLSASQINTKKGEFSFSNNIIDCPGRMIYKFTIGDKPCYDAWTRENNVYYIKQSIRTTTSLTFQFHWRDEETRVSGHSATTKAQTLAAFAEFEPDAKVYWYK